MATPEDLLSRLRECEKEFYSRIDRVSSQARELYQESISADPQLCIIKTLQEECLRLNRETFTYISAVAVLHHYFPELVQKSP